MQPDLRVEGAEPLGGAFASQTGFEMSAQKFHCFIIKHPKSNHRLSRVFEMLWRTLFGRTNR
jgi:hypothetical protein